MLERSQTLSSRSSRLIDSNQGGGFMEGTITQGLEFLLAIFFKVEAHSDLALRMQENLDLFWNGFLGVDQYGAFSKFIQQRRDMDVSERDLMEGSRHPLPFKGDKLNAYPGESYPPLEWTLLWEGTYNNVFGGFTGENLAHWGYVMWNSERLERTGVKDVLARHRKMEWYDENPRE
jgi:hypothetical protein